MKRRRNKENNLKIQTTKNKGVVQQPKSSTEENPWICIFWVWLHHQPNLPIRYMIMMMMMMKIFILNPIFCTPLSVYLFRELLPIALWLPVGQLHGQLCLPQLPKLLTGTAKPTTPKYLSTASILSLSLPSYTDPLNTNPFSGQGISQSVLPLSSGEPD